MTERPTNAWLSIGAYARVYGITRHTVYKWLDADVLTIYKVPPRIVRIKNQTPEAHFAAQSCQDGNTAHACASSLRTL